MTLLRRAPANVLRLALLGLSAWAAAADTDDPAARQVRLLDDSLLKSMHAGATESVMTRYRQLEPVIKTTFDLPLMTRLSVGPAWTTFPAGQQQAVVAAFTRLTIAGYAHNFQQYSGETFDIDDKVMSRGDDKIIYTHIGSGHDTPTTVIYRTRAADGVWKIIDVYYDGISQLTMRRSDFGAVIADGGADGLIAHLNKLSDDYLAH